MSRKKAGCYVFRTRKPHAVLGLPIIGRHFGYVGQTVRSFEVRSMEHVEGGGKYNATPKPWSDLEPKRYDVPLPRWEWLQLAIEQLLIWLLCPVYNDKGQGPWNVRRIPLSKAKAQRKRRDELGAGYRLLVTAGRWAVWVLLTVVVWMIWGPEGMAR